MMRIRGRLGLGIARDRVSAVLLDGEVVRWVHWRPRDAGTPLADALRALLADCPLSRFVRPRVIAAVGPSAVQLKRLTELPSLTDPRVLAAVVREHVDRFFLKNDQPLVFSGARVESPGRVWIAAFEAPVVTDLIEASRDLRLRLHGIVPTAVALRSVLTESEISWSDGDVRILIKYGDHELTSLRCVPDTDAVRVPPAFVASLAALGARAYDVMDAAGAAHLPRGEAIVLRVKDLHRRATPSRRRLSVAAVACAIAVVFAMLSSGLASSLVVRRAHARHTLIASRASAAARDERALAATSIALAALSAFVRTHRSMALVLAQVTRALPEGSTLLALEIDSTGAGNLVAIAPHAAAVVDAVERVPVFTSPEIVGAVTHESLGGRAVERVILRFRVFPAEGP